MSERTATYAIASRTSRFAATVAICLTGLAPVFFVSDASAALIDIVVVGTWQSTNNAVVNPFLLNAGDKFAATRMGVTPDLITTAKGLTSGTVPMGAVLAKGDVYDTFMTGPEGAIEFFHGYTYSGHPLAYRQRARIGCSLAGPHVE